MRRSRWSLLPVLAASALTAVGVLAGGDGRRADAASAASYVETFDGQPSAPRPFRGAGWDVTVHSRDVDTWHQLETVHAQHGHDCGAPPASHGVTSYEATVFSCRDHLMTALNTTGYGLIYLTPDHMVDFSAGEAVVRFDVSTLRSSTRDWIDLWITPYDDNLQLALMDWLPDLTGPPRNAIHVMVEQDNTFKVFVYEDFQATELDQRSSEGYDAVLTPDARRRDTFELRLSPSHVRFGMPAYDHWWVDSAMPDLDWTRGIVQLGHHSYNPTKDCPGQGCGPTTWHWDDVVIEPAVPFTMIGADRRYVDEATTDAIRFARPAPAGAHLRFAGIGADLEVSFDRGATWQPAQMQDQYRQPVDESFRSHWMPVPAGTQEVRFRGQQWWGGSWMVRDASIWSPDASSTRGVVSPPPAAACERPGHWAAGGWARFVRRMCAAG